MSESTNERKVIEIDGVYYVFNEERKFLILFLFMNLRLFFENRIC